MGPRLVGRGKDVHSGPSAHQPYPFNGAASCGTRKGFFCDSSRYVLCPFNGAASCGTRKDGSSVTVDEEGRAFNGAASCGTRKDQERWAEYRYAPSLQWGRVLWDAESVLDVTPNCTASPLQWGRVLWDAERGAKDQRSARCCAFNGAASCGTRKGPQAVPYRHPRKTFNGAASCGTRKARHGWRPCEKGFGLQWGRVLWDAERLRRIPSNISLSSPSMGPRLVGRGKSRGGLYQHSVPSPSMGPRLVGRGKSYNNSRPYKHGNLQWGRVLWDAERANHTS